MFFNKNEKRIILDRGLIRIVKKEKRVKSSGKFFAWLFLFFENSNREIDQVVKTHLTPFLINSHSIWHLTRKSSSGVKSSLYKFVWKNFLIYQEHALKLVPSTSLWMILQVIGWPLNSYEWPRQNFSLQYQYDIKQTSNGKKKEDVN